MNGLDPQLMQYLIGMYPQLASLMQPQSPAGGQQDVPATTPAATPAAAPVGGLGGLGGMPQQPRNEWAPDNATDVMWLRQNNPGQLQTLNQQEMAQPGYDPAKAKWGMYNAANGFGQSMMDRDVANLTGTWFAGRN